MKNGGSAFPHGQVWVGDSPSTEQMMVEASGGMTLRDYFAAKAMHAMLNTELRRDMWASVEKIAIDAYKQADAMLKARGE
jgi:hypothetical protein